MISPREIIAEMTIQEIGFKTLYHQLQDYIKISESEVQDFMSMGVKRPAAIKHVGYILNMKKHCPADFVPKKIEIVIPPRQLVMDITHKKTAKTKEWIDNRNKFNELLNPEYLMMVMPPKSVIDGKVTGHGYWTKEMPELDLVKQKGKKFNKEMENCAMPEVTTAVNLMQSTAYKINPFILKVSKVTSIYSIKCSP